MTTYELAIALWSTARPAFPTVLGLAGVVLARLVFVDRENRRLGRRQTTRETLPLTLIAMLIETVFVIDQDLGFTKAAFTGLGVGWTVILLMDQIGRRVLDPGQPAPPPTAVPWNPNHGLLPRPDDMDEVLDRVSNARRRAGYADEDDRQE